MTGDSVVAALVGLRNGVNRIQRKFHINARSSAVRWRGLKESVPGTPPAVVHCEVGRHSLLCIPPSLLPHYAAADTSRIQCDARSGLLSRILGAAFLIKQVHS